MTTDLQYAGFWSRLKAGLIDFAVFLPLTPLNFWALGEGVRAAAMVYIATYLLYFAYSIVGHALWGQTLGKRLARIKVHDTAGRCIGWSRAWRRSSVDIALGAFSATAYIAVLSRITPAEFEALGWIEVQERYASIRPLWAAAAEYAYWAWLASEVVSVLLNRRRRALHDYLGGTVVTYVGALAPVARSARPAGPRALVWANGIVGAAAAVAAALGALAAVVISAAPDTDPNARTGLLVLTAGAGLIAVAFGSAARAAHTGSRLRWIAQAVALGVALLVVLPFLML